MPGGFDRNSYLEPSLPSFAVLAGVTLHITIMVTIAVGFFTPAMRVQYLAFATPQGIQPLPEVVKAHVPQRMKGVVRRPTAEVEPLQEPMVEPPLAAEKSSAADSVV